MGHRPGHPVHARQWIATLALAFPLLALAQNGWNQWGRTPQHAGASPVTAQNPDTVLTTFRYDPFVAQEQLASGGDLLAHYAAPLVDQGDVFMTVKTGSYTDCTPQQPVCGPAAWESQSWNIRRWAWRDGALAEQWSFASDWKPEPDRGGLAGWEPVFHAALAGDFLYVPGAGGSVYRVRRDNGNEAAHVIPFPGSLHGASENTYVSGPLTVDAQGNVYYNVLRLDPTNPWSSDVQGSWLVKIKPDDSSLIVSYADLTPGAPAKCTLSFSNAQLPWPPSPDATPAVANCGAQRAGVNIAPAVAADGTIVTVSRAHLNSRYSYLIAVNPDLTPKWAASLRDRLNDGCGTSTLPPNGAPGGCRLGAPTGVDPATNQLPAGRVNDSGSSTPVIAPDGSILYGAYTGYNYSRGHLMKFGPDGTFLAAYDFGWDTTPAIFPHDGTYSVLLKDNHYETTSYCGVQAFCPVADGGPYSLVRLDPSLKVEWSFVNTNPSSCERLGDGTLKCVDDHPEGFEWCINAPAVDAAGTVFANSEDGNVYAIGADGKLRSRLFLNLALGAAYTPLAIGDDSRIYAENDGMIFVTGSAPPVQQQPDPAAQPGNRGGQRERQAVLSHVKNLSKHRHYQGDDSRP